VRTGLISLAIAATLPSLASAQETSPPPAPKAAPAKTVDEVVVTGEVAPVQTSIDRRSYDVSKDLQAQTGAIADALRNVPSVEVDVQGNVSLRGDGNVTILLDGKPSSLFQGDNKAQALQSLPADSIERVEVITNPSAEFRADGSAGIINLVTKKAKGAARTGSVRVLAGADGRFSASASAGYNAKRLTVASEVAVRGDAQKQRTVDERLLTDPAGDARSVDQVLIGHIFANSLSARTSVDYDLTPKTRIGAETHGNYTSFRPDNLIHFTETDAASSLSDVFDRQTYIHQKRAAAEVSANLRHRFGGDGELVVSLSHEGINDSRIRDGHTLDQIPAAPDVFDQQRINNRLHTTELKGDFTQPLAEMVKLKLGFDIEYDDNAYRNRGFRGGASGGMAPDTALTNLFTFQQTISAAYVTYERPIRALTVLAGLRVEDVRMSLDQVTLGQKDENGYLRAYPSLHLGWKLSDSQQVTANYSHRVQRPDPNEFNFFRFMLDPLNFRAGNPDLKPQQTQSFELGYEYRQTPVVLLATAYYRQNREGVADVLRDLGGGVVLSERNNIAQSRSAGLEVVASGKLSKTLNYSLTVNGTWTELDSLGPSFAPTRSLASVAGHGSLSWQATLDDLFQLNAFLNGKRLTPQGYADPAFGLDLGYRHKITDRVSFVATAQDILGTFHLFQANDTPLLSERTKINFDSRQVRVGLTLTFGGGRQRDPGFEFQSGAAPPP
jgi:outer membrane receptor protein involved in Fe transport